MLVSACPQLYERRCTQRSGGQRRRPGQPAGCSPCVRRSRPSARAEASPPVLLSCDEIGPARLVGRRPYDGFGLHEIATRGGLGEATRLASILPPPQPRGRHEDDRAHQADQDEIDSEDQQHPEPHLSHRPHLPPSAPGAHRQEDSPARLAVIMPGPAPPPPGNSIASIARLLGVSRSTIYLEGFYVSPAEVATS